MRLNGWQRIGVVASGFYILLAIIGIGLDVYEEKITEEKLLILGGDNVKEDYYDHYIDRNFYSWRDKKSDSLATREYLRGKFFKKYENLYPTCNELKSQGKKSKNCNKEELPDQDKAIDKALIKLTGESRLGMKRPNAISFSEYLVKLASLGEIKLEKDYKVGTILAVIFLPVLLTWGLLYFVFFLARWIWKGFEK